MPGAPPISTREPGTSPPPSTRSNSPIPVFSRSILGASTSPSGTGFKCATATWAAPRASTRASPRSSCSTRRSPGSGRATSGSRGRRRCRRRRSRNAIPARLRAALDGLAPSTPGKRPPIRPPDAVRWLVRVRARCSPRPGRVHRARHRDPPLRRRPVRDDGGRGSGSWAAGSCMETYDSLVRVERPLSRGIQRFTGITQGMVDGAPPPEEVPEVADMLEGRVLVAHNARFDVGCSGPSSGRSRLAEAACALHGAARSPLRAPGAQARGLTGGLAGDRG